MSPASNAVKVTGTVCAVVLLAAGDLRLGGSTVFAQQLSPLQSQSVGRGVFGARDRQQTSSILVSIVEGYDSDTPQELRGTLDRSGLVATGLSTGVNVAGTLGWEGARLQFGATGASSWRYYNQSDEFRTLSHTGGAGVSAGLWGTARLELNQTAAYSPSFLYGLFPSLAAPELGSAVPSGPDYSIRQSDTYIYGSHVAFTHPVGRRRVVRITGDYALTQFRGSSETRQDLRSRGGRAEVRQPFERNVALNIAYQFRQRDFGFSDPVRSTEHGMDIGLAYSRPLSATRRAVFEFAFGGSALDVSADGGGSRAYGNVGLLRGQVSLGYQFRRTWQARAVYRRALEHVADLPNPVLVDGFSSSVEGLASRRAELMIAAGYSSGASPLQRGSLSFDTYTGSVRMRYALTRAAALTAEYLYYYYDFRGRSSLAPGLPAALKRNAVRAGVTIWLPILGR